MPTIGTPPATGGGGFGAQPIDSGGGGMMGGGMTSPITPNISDQSRPNDNFTGGFGIGTGGGGGYGFGGGGQRTFGSGPTNFFGGNTTTNIAGDTSFSKDIETNQKKPEKRTYAAAAPKQSQMIGMPNLAVQQLANMQHNPYMRRA